MIGAINVAYKKEQNKRGKMKDDRNDRNIGRGESSKKALMAP